MRTLRLLSLFAAAAVAPAQAEPDHGVPVPIAIDSGLVANTAPGSATLGLPQVVWSTVVTVPGATWLRLRYAGVLLAGSRDPGGDGSFLRLTSLVDGACQTQHRVHVGQWRDTSAYFNGEAVLVELLAHPGTGDNRIVLDLVTAGPISPIGTDTICGSVDDRVLSNNPRVARNQPTGCTSWLIDDCNHCFLTAGHCSSGLQVVQFNVPLSTSGGAIQHPPPSDQYAVDPASLQSNGGQGVGNDWAYFGVFPNSTTGLTPFQANGGVTFALIPPPPVAGQQIRVTGNGSVTAPVSPTWYLVQKTHAGPYAAFTGTTVQYATDTTGGNSGSPVILDGTEQAIGIHTHGGCTSTGGANNGTGSNHAALQQALANPLGVCDCPELEFGFPNGLPSVLAPAGGTVVRMQIGGPVAVQPGTLQCQVTTTSGAHTVLPVVAGPDLYDFPLPAALCGSAVSFWFEALGSNAVVYRSPANAPLAQHAATAADTLATLRDFDFETAPAGWSVINVSLATGAWVRGVPVDSRGPSADYDGSGQCWVTGNTNLEDVDGGPTQLLTDVVDLTAAGDPVVTFATFYTSTAADDVFLIEASNDGGSSWTTVQSLASSTGWTLRTLPVRSLFPAPAQFRMRFSVADQPNNSVAEGALDAFRIVDTVCLAPNWTAYGSGCAGGGSAPALQAVTLPALGGTFTLSVQGLGGGLPLLLLGSAQVALPLGPPAAPGCELLTTIDQFELLLPIGGTATWSYAIPAAPALAGLRAHLQALELGPQWTLSAGGTAEVR